MAFLRCALRLPSRPHLRTSREIGCTQQTRTEIASGGRWGGGAEGLAERAPKQEWVGEEERVNSKRTLEFHSKN